MSGSKKRFTVAPFAHVRGACSWCGTKDLPKGRRSWCGDECVDAYLMVSSSEHIRKKVFERDKGICSACGCDADLDYKAWQERRKEALRLADRLIWSSRSNMEWRDGKMMGCAVRDDLDPVGWSKDGRKFSDYIAAKYAAGRWTDGKRKSGWDADHIVPVAEGGGECSLENYRTLCHPCHKIETAALAARLATKRKGL
jgi:5-methylcytosine-specific restriction endonuclease McrA